MGQHWCGERRYCPFLGTSLLLGPACLHSRSTNFMLGAAKGITLSDRGDVAGLCRVWGDHRTFVESHRMIKRRLHVDSVMVLLRRGRLPAARSSCTWRQLV